MPNYIFANKSSSNEPTKKADTSSSTTEKWKVMVVDDDLEVHTITKMVLSNFTFEGSKIEFTSAYSGQEACQLIEKESNIALILLDVVMETDHAGLEVVKYIRENLKNPFVRIVLRTGQPGQAPENEVIINYDIDDYKEKTELTSQKLFTLMRSNLRSYRNIMSIEKNKQGLREVIQSLDNIYQFRSLNQLLTGVATQLCGLLHLTDNTLIINNNHLATANLSGSTDIKVLCGTGCHETSTGSDITQLDDSIQTCIKTALEKKQSICTENGYAYYTSRHNNELVMYFSGINKIDTLSAIEKHLIDIFLHNVTTCLENLKLSEESDQIQRKIINTLGSAVENRSKETGAHIQRVAEYSKLLAIKLGLSATEAEIVEMASPLHDIGKVAIPDAILHKPEKLTDTEWEVMKTHAEAGYNILKGDESRVFYAASVIAQQHHEKWDGSGYPNQLAGEDIHIYGRITALADVFDALSSKRCYKSPWEIDDVLGYITKERAKHFDPTLVDILINNIDEFISIKERYKDR
ncbi:DUF3369 domain-containing protein [Spartinivicinus poritis]|uniref:DUF3369 domain-containing protein n=1 Tax=Spartinivicinus poritis TaxID=2994640 RepID=A0ABT5U9E1_9GAMM|nr:DUF3369 domain-containing protein [Spartinivicinus sp. A2-2]MDE1462970.1 DUF3369 domain-containing protein [Spartinivicinus sp. A2-2]